MKQTATNSFSDGLNLDLHPIVTPNTVLTDNLNGTFITYNGNEFCLQNDRGNKEVAHLSAGYTPIGIKEHNGILYIVSYSPTEDKTEIGTYPGVDWNVEEETNSPFSREYKPLQNIKAQDPTFSTDAFDYDLGTPVTIEIQDSYDGSVNLILVADQRKTRIVNSGFSVINDKQYKIPKRNQTVLTNYYNDIDRETELIRTSNEITNVDLLGVQSGGQFKGGNYTFYIKFGDADYNQTDVVAESGIVSVFNGNDGVPSTISGTLLDERTDKMIQLEIQGLNHVYSKIYIYYSREYSDTQGYRMTEYGMFSEPIDMDKTVQNQKIWLTGFEQTVPIEPELLNVDYHTVDWARAEAQHSNMLFLGNVGQEETFQLYDRLRTFSKQVTITENQSTLPIVNTDYEVTPDLNNAHAEYYNTQNIYNRLGYYPGEIYRFGIVYILKDGSKTPVFNVRGNVGENDDIYKGVFKTSDVKVIENNIVKPIYLTFTVPVITEPDVIGWFIVRQKRIPNTICEGLSIAIDRSSNIPVVWNGQNWVTQSFIDVDRNKISDYQYIEEHSSKGAWKGYGVEAMNAQLTYNNANLISGVFTEEKFDEWRRIKNYNYAEHYWVDLNEEGDSYAIDPNLVIPEGTVYEQLEVCTRNIVQKYINAHPEVSERSYSIFVGGTDNGSPEEETAIAEIINSLENGGVFNLKWYQRYRNVGINQETHVPEDAPEEIYLVGLNDTKIQLKIHDEFEVGSINLNAQYRSSWEAQYKGYLSGRKLTKKMLKELDPESYWKEANALLSLDPCVNSSIAGILDGSKFYINLARELFINSNSDELIYRTEVVQNSTATNPFNESIKSVFVNSNTGIKVIDNYEFSTIAGEASDVSQFKYFTFPDGVFEKERAETLEQVKNYLINHPNATELDVDMQSRLHDLYRTNLNINLIRGLFTPYVGLANKTVKIPFGVYSIKHKNTLNNEDYLVRIQDNSEYYTITKYIKKSNSEATINVFGGDCYINTVTMRIIRNFIDSTAPVSDVILDSDGWQKYVVRRDMNGTAEDNTYDNKGHATELGMIRYDQVNLSDVNTVDLGIWVTFKCLSSYNLGLRSKDTFHTDEMAILGSPRSFYPLNGASTATGNKMEESFLLNDGLSATVGRKRYNLMPDVPYSKSEFANRIMFSNVNVTDAFTNGYRTFQGLSYKDYDKQYGAITKLISLGQNIFIVMEHGLGLVPVNPKALMQTTTGETIHIYGYGVLPDEMTIISQDYGSKYEHSVIRTPIGIYGIDVDAKKIWRFSDKQGFETISDMKIETYLKNNLKLQEIEMGNSDIRTHYNGKKGDLMFTWYHNEEIYSICYNERQNLWVTRYDWTPIVSENINDEFYSLNRAFIAGTEESDPTYSSDYRIWDHHYQVGWDEDNKKPTYVSTWYDNNRGFEFEFVVSDPIGINKIFENLQIISNNVSPEELQITVIGDDYTFKRDEIAPDYKRKEYPNNATWTTSNIHENDKEYRELEDTVYKWDWRLHQMAIVNTQELRDIYKHGRRLGNMQYKNGMWFIQIDPLRFNINVPQQKKEVRIRDKWAKIRIRYSGKDLAIITAIRTLINV